MDAEASCYNKAPSEEWTQVVQFINELSVNEQITGKGKLAS